MLREELCLPGDSGAGGRLELQHHGEQGRVNVPTQLSKKFVNGWIRVNRFLQILLNQLVHRGFILDDVDLPK